MLIGPLAFSMGGVISSSKKKTTKMKQSQDVSNLFFCPRTFVTLLRASPNFVLFAYSFGRKYF